MLIPRPQGPAAERLQVAIDALTPGQRKLIRVIDKDGRAHERVESYIAPLASVNISPVNQVRTSLYLASLAARHGAAVYSGTMLELQYLMAILSPGEKWPAEAKERFAEAIGIASSYRPLSTPRISYDVAFSPEPLAEIIERALHSSEFEAAVRSHGALALLRRPKLALDSLRQKVSALVRRDDFKTALSLTEATASLATLPFPGGALRQIAGTVEKGNRFAPLFQEDPYVHRALVDVARQQVPGKNTKVELVAHIGARESREALPPDPTLVEARADILEWLQRKRPV